MRRHLLLGALAAAAVSLTACRGGSSSLPPSVGGSNVAESTAAAPGLAGTVAFTVTIPPAGSGSPIPQSVLITLVKGVGLGVKMAPLTMNLTAATSSCQSLSAGGLKCAVAVTAPSGNDTFNITTFAGVNGTGARLSTAQAQTAVVASSLSKTACTPKSSDLATLQTVR
jgi:hypothetical protein